MRLDGGGDLVSALRPAGAVVPDASAADPGAARSGRNAGGASPFDSIEDAIDDIRAGKMVVVLDDEDRENEGDLVMAAQMVTPEAINFMRKEAGGLICVPLIGARLDELRFRRWCATTRAVHETAFTVSVEARGGTTTGISAHDRAATIQALLDPATRPARFSAARSHVSAARARRRRAGARRTNRSRRSISRAWPGLYPAGVICEIMAEDGTMERLDGLHRIRRAARPQTDHRQRPDRIPHAHRKTRQARRRIRLCRRTYGTWTRRTRSKTTIDDNTHVALVMGDIGDGKDLLVRVHSECLTGDALHSIRCDCAAQRDGAMDMIANEGRGVFLYLRQEGRGIGLANKLRAYELQDQGADTVEANLALGLPVDKRDYGIGSQILADLGVKEMRLITNNPRKIFGLEGYGLKIVGRVPMQTEPTNTTSATLQTKRNKLGHMFDPATGVAVTPSGASARRSRVKTEKQHDVPDCRGKRFADLAHVSTATLRPGLMTGRSARSRTATSTRKTSPSMMCPAVSNCRWRPNASSRRTAPGRASSRSASSSGGETPHFDFVAGECARGIMTVAARDGRARSASAC